MTDRVAVVGGGIVGVAVAREILTRRPDAQVTLYEKEDRLAVAPDRAQQRRGPCRPLLPARFEQGRALPPRRRSPRGVLRAARNPPHRNAARFWWHSTTPNVHVWATSKSAHSPTAFPALRTIGPEELRELEPHVRGVAALHSPSTSIVDFAEVTQALAADAVAAGAKILLGQEVIGLRTTGSEVVVTARAASGTDESAFDQVVACGGLQSDRLAELAGDGPEPVIMPFRGEYYALKPERRGLVNGLVYPVPDPRYPFLGVHITPRVDGEVFVGPNAVLALAREGYTWGTVSVRDLAEIARTPAFWRFARRHWRTGIREMHGSLSKRRFVAAARAYVPEINDDDVVPGTAGVRAQALEADGALVDDFRISIRDRIVLLRNAPSPAATSALAIAEHVVSTINEARRIGE